MEIYQRYGGALLRKCERMLKSKEDAEDIVQALFIDLLKKGRTEVDLPYLFRACTNRCLNLLRDKKKRMSLLEREADTMAYPQRTLLDNQVVTRDLLVNLLDRLDQKTSETLVYRYFDDLGQDEIALLMNTSRKTVGKRLNKIRSQAEQLLERERGVKS